jgi:non-specific serine/threonine protein kinase
LTETHITLLLPSGKRGPQPSPQLLWEEEGASVVADRLAAWMVPAVGSTAPAAAGLLLSLSEASHPGVVLAGSHRFFGEVAGLAAELVARGRVIPAVGEGPEALARWQAVLDGGRDQARLGALARALPPMCRAEQRPGGAARADQVVRSALQGFVDGLVRAGLTEGGWRPKHRALTALVAPDGKGKASPADLAGLGDSLSGWAERAEPPADFRACFRLVPPPGEQAEPFRVDLLVQAVDDPSLLVSAAQVWKARGRTLRVLEHSFEDPQERLLGALGRAANLYPELEGALRRPRPEALDLDAGGAYRFLRQFAPLLEQAGFGVLVPSWWGKPSARLGVRLRARPSPAATSSGLLGMAALVDYHFEVALGDETVTAEELAELARLKAPLVRMGKGWVELRPEDVEAALAILDRGTAGNMTITETLRVGLGLEGEGGLPVVAMEAESWLGRLFGTDQTLEPIASPAGFSGTLRPYQERGLSWLAFLDGLGLGACLADDMGLGKTIQVLALLVAEREGAQHPSPTLLVCPMSVVGNWQREAERFAPKLTVHIHHGSERLLGPALAEAVAHADLVVTTYALVARDQEALSAVEWGRVVLDEAQNVKNPGARQAQAARALPTRRRVALTGTPVENRLAELWSIMEFLNPGLLGSQAAFRRTFSIPIERYRDQGQADLLRRLTMPFVLRRLKTDRSIIADLPEKLEMKVYCNLTREQASLYQAVVDDMLAKVAESEGIERRGLVLATMLKLKQVCNHPTQLSGDRSPLTGRSGKLARLEEVLEEVVAGGDRALCFTQFAEWGHRLRPHLQERLGVEVLYLHGGTRKPARDEMVARFQSPSGPPIFLLSLKAGGIGLNLTAANHVIHFDRWWNPAVEDQATDRAFRIGQRRDVWVRKLVCVGTLEERIDRMIEEKRELAERIVGTGEAWLTELSTEELRSLVALSAEAVAE